MIDRYVFVIRCPEGAGYPRYEKMLKQWNEKAKTKYKFPPDSSVTFTSGDGECEAFKNDVVSYLPKECSVSHHVVRRYTAQEALGFNVRQLRVKRARVEGSWKHDSCYQGVSRCPECGMGELKKVKQLTMNLPRKAVAGSDFISCDLNMEDVVSEAVVGFFEANAPGACTFEEVNNLAGPKAGRFFHMTVNAVAKVAAPPTRLLHKGKCGACGRTKETHLAGELGIEEWPGPPICRTDLDFGFWPTKQPLLIASGEFAQALAESGLNAVTPGCPAHLVAGAEEAELKKVFLSLDLHVKIEG